MWLAYGNPIYFSLEAAVLLIITSTPTMFQLLFVPFLVLTGINLSLDCSNLFRLDQFTVGSGDGVAANGTWTDGDLDSLSNSTLESDRPHLTLPTDLVVEYSQQIAPLKVPDHWEQSSIACRGFSSNKPSVVSSAFAPSTVSGFSAQFIPSTAESISVLEPQSVLVVVDVSKSAAVPLVKSGADLVLQTSNLDSR